MTLLNISLLIAALVFHTSGAAVAAECPGCTSDDGCFASHYRLAAAVFSGKVVGTEYRKTKTDHLGEANEVEVLAVKFEVDRWWKGGDATEVFVYTADWRLPDGSRRVVAEFPDFKTGEVYLVYAFAGKVKGELKTIQCSRTGLLNGKWKSRTAEEDLRRLGEGKAPVKEG